MTTLDLVDLAVQRRSLLVRLGGQGRAASGRPGGLAEGRGDLDGGIEQGLERLVGRQGRVGVRRAAEAQATPRCSSGRSRPG
jgi:hypothetical protein